MTLKAQFAANEVELVLIDGPVSPVQQRNLEKAWGVKILDRTGLILEIFSDRARTREGVLQVEMAALSYQRTRLVRAWTHLDSTEKSPLLSEKRQGLHAWAAHESPDWPPAPSPWLQAVQRAIAPEVPAFV